MASVNSLEQELVYIIFVYTMRIKTRHILKNRSITN